MALGKRRGLGREGAMTGERLGRDVGRDSHDWGETWGMGRDVGNGEDGDAPASLPGVLIKISSFHELYRVPRPGSGLIVRV